MIEEYLIDEEEEQDECDTIQVVEDDAYIFEDNVLSLINMILQYSNFFI